MNASRLGRKDVCPCGSGQKYKRCCYPRPVLEPSPPSAGLALPRLHSDLSQQRAFASPHRRMTSFPVGDKQVPVWAGEVQFLQLLRTLPPEVLYRKDIAELNLLCATELPGAEDLTTLTPYMSTLTEWAAHIGQTTERLYAQFRDNPADYDDSEPYWRMLILTTVLQQHYRIKYDRDKIADMDWRDSRDLFIHGLLGPKRSGTCGSLPVLLAALGRRLGYPIYLVLAPGHVFSRWEDPRIGVRFNIECHGNGLVVHPDEYYHHHPVEWTPELHAEENRLGARRVFMRSLMPAENLAFFLAQRGHVWESLGRWGEATAVYNLAADLSPHNRAYGFFASEAWRKMADPLYELDERPRWKGVTITG